jgi:hypothetical protein
MDFMLVTEKADTWNSVPTHRRRRLHAAARKRCQEPILRIKLLVISVPDTFFGPGDGHGQDGHGGQGGKEDVIDAEFEVKK